MRSGQIRFEAFQSALVRCQTPPVRQIAVARRPVGREGAVQPTRPDRDPGREPGVDPVTIALLRELARGRTISQAAATCNVSTATAWRRFDALRQDWGVDHTIQLVVQAVRRGLV
jgi:DNA-binding NarL/FixJ family response regulator